MDLAHVHAQMHVHTRACVDTHTQKQGYMVATGWDLAIIEHP